MSLSVESPYTVLLFSKTIWASLFVFFVLFSGGFFFFFYAGKMHYFKPCLCVLCMGYGSSATWMQTLAVDIRRKRKKFSQNTHLFHLDSCWQDFCFVFCWVCWGFFTEILNQVRSCKLFGMSFPNHTQCRHGFNTLDIWCEAAITV